ERNQRGTHGDHLTWGQVHVVNRIADDHGDVTVLQTNGHGLIGDSAVFVVVRVRLGDNEAVLLIGGQVIDLLGELAVDNTTVGGFDETEGVHAGVGRQGTDQADVRAFRGFNRAHAAVVGRVNVSHLDAGALTGQTTRAESRQTTLVGQTRQRVVLVHELGQLRGSE